MNLTQNEFVPRIPYGTRDFLPREAAEKRRLEAELAALFGSWGYDEVVTPTFEYLETLEAGSGGENQVFKFFDQHNRLVALRHEMTTPIARVAATRLKEAEPPLKLFYLTNVFRQEEAQTGRQCEFYQGGIEVLGVADSTADAEVIALAVESMRSSGLKNFKFSLGQVDFINGLMDSVSNVKNLKARLRKSVTGRNLVELEECLSESPLAEQERKALQELPLLHGGREVLSHAGKITSNPICRQALENLWEIYELLNHYDVSEYVNFDLGLTRDLDYYTGMVFEGYAPGLGFPICGGGRYDRMLEAFGVECPATGFALGVERIMLALERQKTVVDTKQEDVYLAWAADCLPLALKQAAELRSVGCSVELALRPQLKSDAEWTRQEKGRARLVYVNAE